MHDKLASAKPRMWRPGSTDNEPSIVALLRFGRVGRMMNGQCFVHPGWWRGSRFSFFERWISCNPSPMTKLSSGAPITSPKCSFLCLSFIQQKRAPRPRLHNRHSDPGSCFEVRWVEIRISLTTAFFTRPALCYRGTAYPGCLASYRAFLSFP
jgi:hypothetical protein